MFFRENSGKRVGEGGWEFRVVLFRSGGGGGGRKGLTARRASANFLFLSGRLTRKQRGERRKVEREEDGAKSRKGATKKRKPKDRKSK